MERCRTTKYILNIELLSVMSRYFQTVLSCIMISPMKSGKVSFYSASFPFYLQTLRHPPFRCRWATSSQRVSEAQGEESAPTLCVSCGSEKGVAAWGDGSCANHRMGWRLIQKHCLTLFNLWLWKLGSELIVKESHFSSSFDLSTWFLGTWLQHGTARPSFFFRPITALLVGTPKARLDRRTRISSLKLAFILGKSKSLGRKRGTSQDFGRPHWDMLTSPLSNSFRLLSSKPWISDLGKSHLAEVPLCLPCPRSRALPLARQPWWPPRPSWHRVARALGEGWGANRNVGLCGSAKSNMIWHDMTRCNMRQHSTCTTWQQMQINFGATTTPQDRKTVGRRQSESSSACAGKLWGVPPHRWSRSLQVGTMMDNGIQWACELSKYVEITSMTNSRQHPRRGGCCQCGGLDGNVLGTTQHKALLSPQKLAFVISDPTLAEFVTYSWRAFARASAYTNYKSILIPVFMSRIIRLL